MHIINKLYKSYQQEIYYYLYGLTKNQVLSEDLTSETFASAIKSLPNFRGDSNIKTWLFSIARHKWYEYIRKEKSEKIINERLECYIIEKQPIDINDFDNKEIVERILQLLEQEGSRQKEIVMLRIEGYSFYEIGEKIGISENSARVIDFRTRKKVRETLKKEGYEND